jgi:hypothetical protein
MTDERDIVSAGGGEPAHGLTPSEGSADLGASSDSGGEGAARRRPGLLEWVGRIALSLLVIVVGFAGLAALLYNFGTMETPSAEIQGQYEQLVASGQVPPPAASPGFRIPIPGCRCHAADPDIGIKQPGRTPDVSLVMAHRYRTISQCGRCHGGSEPPGVEGQPLEDAPPQ